MAYEVTIGIPVYNIEKYIRRAMDSALEQSFQSIEFLILDDCGTDRSIDIIRDYQRSHSRGNNIRIVRQPRNMRLGNARNRMIDEATGRYIYFLDGDDMIAPNAIELLYYHAQLYNAQIVYGSYERIEDFGEGIKRIPCQYQSSQFLEGDLWPEFVYRKYEGIQAMIWNCLIDLNVYRQNGLRHKPVQFWEDFTFTMDFPTYVTRAVLLPDITYYYYCREGSLSNYQTRNQIPKEEILTTIEAVEAIKDNSDRIRNKSYFPLRMYKLMMTDFYIICTIIKDKRIISPAFTDRELHDIMRSPLSLGEIVRFRHARLKNFVLYLFWILPPFLSVPAMKLLCKLKKL